MFLQLEMMSTTGASKEKIAGKTNKVHTVSGTSTIRVEMMEEKVECGVCMMETRHPFRLTLCEHKFCQRCLLDYATVCIKEAKTRIPCPDEKCKTELHPDDIRKLIASNVELSNKYEKFDVRNALIVDSGARWCPKDGCDYVCLVSPDSQKCPLSTCALCQTEFCVLCGEISHRDRPCSTAATNFPGTKSCPRCLITIEKNNGCNLMTCPQWTVKI